MTKNKDFYDDLPQHVKDSIEEGIKDFKEGNVYAHEEVMKEIREKYGLENERK